MSIMGNSWKCMTTVLSSNLRNSSLYKLQLTVSSYSFKTMLFVLWDTCTWSQSLPLFLWGFPGDFKILPVLPTLLSADCEPNKFSPQHAWHTCSVFYDFHSEQFLPSHKLLKPGSDLHTKVAYTGQLTPFMEVSTCLRDGVSTGLVAKTTFRYLKIVHGSLPSQSFSLHLANKATISQFTASWRCPQLSSSNSAERVRPDVPSPGGSSNLVVYIISYNPQYEHGGRANVCGGRRY